MSAKFSAHSAWRGEFRLLSETGATEVPAVPSTNMGEGKFLISIIDTQLNSAVKPKLLAEVRPSILHAICMYACNYMHHAYIAV